jgi:Flp pilus assembly protein TadD
MTPPAPQAPRTKAVRWGTLVAVALVALSVTACQKRGHGDITGAIPGPQQGTPEIWRRQADLWAPRFDANPGDPAAAMHYARALRALDQKPQAVAVLQQATIRNPKNPELLAAYGKALSEVGRYAEAAEVLGRAHTPERPDWRVLSAQGAVADQTGNHALAQKYYESALKLAPGEPTVLSNLGLSYALMRRLDEAERTLQEAAERPGADARVRQNLALVLSLRGKFAEAEATLRKDHTEDEASDVVADLRAMAAQSGGALTLQKSDPRTRPARG